MAQRTYKDIEAEANRRFGKGASQAKFEFRRQQQEAAGLEKETKKRGGVAGAYDRNKALVQAAAPVLAGLLVPGAQAGLAGAITGGLARGVDRPGKGGIGLDLGRAATGALSGAAMGQLGGAAKSGLQGMLGGGGALKPMPDAGAPISAVGGAPALPRGAMAAAPAAAAPAATMGGAAQAAATAAPAASRGLLGRILTGAKENAPIIQAGLGAVSDVMGQQAQRATEEARLAQQQQQFQQTFNVSEEERRRQREQANRLAGLFMPRSA